MTKITPTVDFYGPGGQNKRPGMALGVDIRWGNLYDDDSRKRVDVGIGLLWWMLVFRWREYPEAP